MQSKKLVIGSGLLLLFCVFLMSQGSLFAAAQNVRRLNLGTGSVQANGATFYSYTTPNGNILTFESWATNWSADPNPNKVDVFVRDLTADKTTRVTAGNDDSFEPMLSADGRYVIFTSYASDLVPNDNNTTSIWIRDGLDVFMFDRTNGQTTRVSLNNLGQEIKGNSIGVMSPNGKYIIFHSNGTNVITTEGNGDRNPALYVRDWQAGTIERVTYGIDKPNGFPNDDVGGAWSSYDGRFISYNSAASNLVPNDTNGAIDVFLYDQVTKKTIRVSEPPGGGNGNGLSSQSSITADGNHVVFKSEASNLVPNDTNGVSDIFVYHRLTGEIERVSVASDGTQANGLSKDPATCRNGRFISFTTEATNLMANDNNNQRDVFVHDTESGETFVASLNASGQLANGKAHRSFIAADCGFIVFASDGNNLVSNDTNGVRDLFGLDLVLPTDLSGSTLSISGDMSPGGEVTLRYTLQNDGTEPVAAVFSSQLPTGMTYVANSATGGATHSGGKISWSGNIDGASTKVITFKATISGALSDFTLLPIDAQVSGDGQTAVLDATLMVNGIKTYLPIIANS